MLAIEMGLQSRVFKFQDVDKLIQMYAVIKHLSLFRPNLRNFEYSKR